ncbi:ABC transporter permease [Curtobacterium sp. ME26]|uniref:ABC transporter permease n=1 Tax=Curtobacterium sp. ME26 TaxID=2744254 RepID=UPI0015F3E2EE|nr:ABC transporter permease [Curtobacterium sp. ME26]
MSASDPIPQPTPWRRLVPVGVLLAVIVSVIVIAFTWPTVASTAKDVPVAIAGPPAQTAQVADALTRSGDTFDVRVVDDRAKALQLIKERDVYGAVVVSEDAAPEVLTASAASSAVSQILTRVGTELQQEGATQSDAAAATTPTVKITDAVSYSENDPSGAGLAASAFPLVMGGMLGGILLTFLVHGIGRRLTGLAVYAIAAGLAVPAVLQGWFGVLQGPYLENAAAFALALGSVAATILGAAALVGRIGVAVGPVLFMLFANPIASAATPTQFLPGPWGSIGQWFPPGAGNRLLRDISYFPDANAAPQWIVLAAWTALGLALTGIAAVIHRRRSRPRHGEHLLVTERTPDPLTV